MKILLSALLALMLTVPCLGQNENLQWTGFAIGVSTDFFNESPPENLWKNVWLQTSPVFKVAEGNYFLPGVLWKTEPGVLRLQASYYKRLVSFKAGDIYLGGIAAPAEFNLSSSIANAGTAAVGFEGAFTWKLHKQVLLVGGLKYDMTGSYLEGTAKAPIGKLLTLTIGVIGIG